MSIVFVDMFDYTVPFQIKQLYQNVCAFSLLTVQCARHSVISTAYWNIVCSFSVASNSSARQQKRRRFIERLIYVPKANHCFYYMFLPL